MKMNQFTPLTEKEMMTVNGGGILDGIPIVGGLLGSVVNLVQGILSSLGLGINLPI